MRRTSARGAAQDGKQEKAARQKHVGACLQDMAFKWRHLTRLHRAQVPNSFELENNGAQFLSKFKGENATCTCIDRILNRCFAFKNIKKKTRTFSVALVRLHPLTLCARERGVGKHQNQLTF